MFQAKERHKWDEWCSCLWNASANVEAKHLGCYKNHLASARQSYIDRISCCTSRSNLRISPRVTFFFDNLTADATLAEEAYPARWSDLFYRSGRSKATWVLVAHRVDHGLVFSQRWVPTALALHDASHQAFCSIALPEVAWYRSNHHG
jgi:hypothetical protein